VVIPAAALAFLQIKLQVAVSACDFGDARDRLSRQWRAPEIRVNHYPAGVDDAAERRRVRAREASCYKLRQYTDLCFELSVIDSGLGDLCTQLLKFGTYSLQHTGSAVFDAEGFAFDSFQQLIDRR
jgi:hypothetical protein